MFRNLLLATALLGTLAAPALAQNDMASTSFPPSPGNSAEAPIQSLNSLPPGAATASRERPGSDIETTQITPVAPSLAERPADLSPLPRADGEPS